MSLEKRYYAPKGIIMEDMHIEMNETDLIMCCLLVLDGLILFKRTLVCQEPFLKKPLTDII